MDPFKRKAVRDLTQKRRCNTERSEGDGTEVGMMWPQAKECQQPLVKLEEAVYGIPHWRLQRKHDPADTLISSQ